MPCLEDVAVCVRARKSGSNDGWMLTKRPFHRSTKAAVNSLIHPDSTMASTS